MNCIHASHCPDATSYSRLVLPAQPLAQPTFVRIGLFDAELVPWPIQLRLLRVGQ